MAEYRKVKSKVVLPVKVESKEVVKEVAPRRAGKRSDEPEDTKTGLVKKKKYCSFCQNKILPHYWDSASLRRYINDRGRIVPRARLGTCSKHQRRVSKEIKYARHLALLPFTVRV